MKKFEKELLAELRRLNQGIDALGTILNEIAEDTHRMVPEEDK